MIRETPSRYKEMNEKIRIILFSSAMILTILDLIYRQTRIYGVIAIVCYLGSVLWGPND